MIKYLRPQEVAEVYGLNENTLAQWRVKKFGPDFFKMGGVVVYAIDEIEAFIENHRVQCYRPGDF